MRIDPQIANNFVNLNKFENPCYFHAVSKVFADKWSNLETHSDSDNEQERV